MSHMTNSRIEKCIQDTVENAEQQLDQLLKEYDWVKKCNDYAVKILQNINIIKQNKSKFYQSKGLYVYTNVGDSSGNANKFQLRYSGQIVAYIEIQNDEPYLFTSSEQNKNNSKIFKINTYNLSNGVKWTDDKAKEFRKAFAECTKLAKSPEHTLESALLTIFEKKETDNGTMAMPFIQPVKIANICRFQMPTHLKASGKILEPTKQLSRGIDILARIGRGGSSRLCVMELKDEPENPLTTMQQGVAYAVFLRKLLANESDGAWSSIFGYKKYRKEYSITVCIVMPYDEKMTYDETTGGEIIFNHTISTDAGVLKLRQLYIKKDWKNNIQIEREHSTFTSKG